MLRCSTDTARQPAASAETRGRSAQHSPERAPTLRRCMHSDGRMNANFPSGRERRLRSLDSLLQILHAGGRITSPSAADRAFLIGFGPRCSPRAFRRRPILTSSHLKSSDNQDRAFLFSFSAARHSCPSVRSGACTVHPLFAGRDGFGVHPAAFTVLSEFLLVRFL